MDRLAIARARHPFNRVKAASFSQGVCPGHYNGARIQKVTNVSAGGTAASSFALVVTEPGIALELKAELWQIDRGGA